MSLKSFRLVNSKFGFIINDLVSAKTLSFVYDSQILFKFYLESVVKLQFLSKFCVLFIGAPANYKSYLQSIFMQIENQVQDVLCYFRVTLQFYGSGLRVVSINNSNVYLNLANSHPVVASYPGNVYVYKKVKSGGHFYVLGNDRSLVLSYGDFACKLKVLNVYSGKGLYFSSLPKKKKERKKKE